MTHTSQIFMRVKFSSLFGGGMNVYYVTRVLKRGTNIKTIVLITYSSLETRTRFYC